MSYYVVLATKIADKRTMSRKKMMWKKSGHLQRNVLANRSMTIGFLFQLVEICCFLGCN